MGTSPIGNAGRNSGEDAAGAFARLGMRLADWSQRWFPDAFVFALGGLVIVFLFGLMTGVRAQDLIRYFGEGFWGLIPFTMQMAMIIIGGYVVATSPPVHKLIRRLARVPRTPRGAVAFVAFFSIATSMLSWGLGLIFSGVLVREVVRHVRGVDYRAIGVAAYLGNCTVWALGLSSSAALVMATPSSIPAALLKISGVIPLSQTIYTWQSLAMAAILTVSCVTVAYLSTPVRSTKDAESFGVTEGLEVKQLEERKAPAEWLEYAPFLSIVVGLAGMAYLAQVFVKKGPVAVLDLNTYNLLFLMVGLLLHWRPRSFVRAVNDSVPATAGVLIQFPFYGGIFGIITLSAISAKMAHFFVSFSSTGTYPILVSIYSGFLGMFVPSGGGKWIIEAPYVLQAAKDLHVNLGWVVQIYNTAEALPNLINPFWMLPLLGLLKVKARDLIGYGLLYLMVNTGLVLFFMWFFARTLPYVPPILP
ncbi:MAG TPA: TIGR00366 family protein [Candidatus Dormibacteraeota bacterium]|nr:TIGR00366 family protein [Candidatus Dormibacteraeota bacterium]